VADVAREKPAPAIVHIAGLDVRVGNRLRQRCAWCGAMIDDYDLRLVATTDGNGPGTWPVGALIARDGGMTYVMEHDDGADIPSQCCAALDPSVTA
jgi:hypothetical protein